MKRRVVFAERDAIIAALSFAHSRRRAHTRIKNARVHSLGISLSLKLEKGESS